MDAAGQGLGFASVKEAFAVKALVLSGGTAVRFRPISWSMPKQLVPIANKPILEHVLEGIVALGVTEIGIVVGDQADTVAEAIGDGSRFGARITYLSQARPLGLAHAVRIARPFLGDDDFVLYLGDNVLPDGITAIAEEFAARRPAAQIVVQKVADPSAYGVAEVAPDGTVRALVEKPSEPRSDLAVVGVYFFTAAIHRAVAAIRPSARGELEITDAIQWLIGQGAEVRARGYRGFWRDAGQVDDALECNRRLLDELRPAIAGAVDAASDLVGAVVVERSARVVRSRIEGPVIVGAGTLVEDSQIGPYTSIGMGCVVSDSRISDSIILDGASLSSVRSVRDSIIGRSATVGPLGEGDPPHRLVVGDLTRIELASRKYGSSPETRTPSSTTEQIGSWPVDRRAGR
jgi:glucose-1-phosphate thymidylyltransferase